MITFVGSNPSVLRDDAPTLRVFERWRTQMGLFGVFPYKFVNVSTEVTPGNRPLKRSEYDFLRLAVEIDPGAPVVALGNTASDALTLLGIPHFKLPHPSPRNRLLNDRRYEKRVLEECCRFISERRRV